MGRGGFLAKRIVYLDFLRVLSGFLVVMVHVSAQQIEETPVTGWNYAVMNAYNCLAFSGVALFVMISGALALNPDRETGMKRVLLHKTLRFFALYYVWKAIYQAVAMLETGTAFTAANIKSEILLALVQQRGYYHLWFLPMIAIVYMSVSVIKKGVADKAVCRYFLCVFFVVELLFPTLFHYEFKFKYLFVDFFAANAFPLFGGYLGYFILGHMLHRWPDDLSAKKRSLLYAAGFLGWILACVLGMLDARRAGAPSYIMNTPFAVTTFFTSAALFTAGQRVCRRGKDVDESQWQACAECRNGESAGNGSQQEKRVRAVRGEKALHFCADRVLGVYLLHPLVINLFRAAGFDTTLCTPLLSIPLVTICALLASGLTAWLLSRIPIVKGLVC